MKVSIVSAVSLAICFAGILSDSVLLVLTATVISSLCLGAYMKEWGWLRV